MVPELGFNEEPLADIIALGVHTLCSLLHQLTALLILFCESVSICNAQAICLK
jgi:hypothetical protein